MSLSVATRVATVVDAAVADQLVVDLACRLEGRLDVLAQLLVVHRPLDVRPHVAGRVGDLVFRRFAMFRPSFPVCSCSL